MKLKLLLCIFIARLLAAQTYDILIKGGHVIDPANQLDEISDVGISGNKITLPMPWMGPIDSTI
jgi:dihydroorotase